MTTIAGSGTYRHTDSYQAGYLAAQQAVAPLGGRPPSLVVAFTTDTYQQPEVLRGIRAVTGDAHLLGCCSGGIISREGPSGDGVVVLAIHSDTLRVTTAVEVGIRESAAATAELAAERIEGHIPPPSSGLHIVTLMVADGLTGSLTGVVRHAANVLGPLCPLIGGGAGDNLKFHQTCQFVDDQVYSDAVAAALLVSETPIGVGVRHGWTSTSRGLVVTRSEGNVVYEFDGRPAFEAYRELFPQDNLTPENFGAFVMAHPIGLPLANGEFLIRDPLRARPDGAIECVASVPENAVAHIMQGDPAALFQAAQDATKQALDALGGRPPVAVLVFDCVSRLLMLGEQAATEVEMIRAIIGPETPMAGMFSFGEIATGAGAAALHNKTVVVCAIS